MNGPGTKIQSHAALSENTLSLEEQQERLHLERKVERAFYEAGKSLTQLRDRKLYRNTHASFEEYCRERFSFQPRHCYQLIDAARVVDHLIQSLNFDERCAPVAHILPTKERQVRPLTALPSEEQKEAWVSAIAAAGGKIPNSRQVTEAVQIIKDRLSQSQLNFRSRIPTNHNPFYYYDAAGRALRGRHGRRRGGNRRRHRAHAQRRQRRSGRRRRRGEAADPGGGPAGWR